MQLSGCQHWLSAIFGLAGVYVCVHLSMLLMFAGKLPDSWAGAEAFPLLTDLTLADLPFQTGRLPTAWANNGSFPVLNSLMIGLSALDSTSLSGSLPTEWGHPDAFESLHYLILGGCFTGTRSSTKRSSYQDLDHVMTVVHRLHKLSVHVSLCMHIHGNHWQIFRCCHECSVTQDHVLT